MLKYQTQFQEEDDEQTKQMQSSTSTTSSSLLARRKQYQLQPIQPIVCLSQEEILNKVDPQEVKTNFFSFDDINSPSKIKMVVTEDLKDKKMINNQVVVELNEEEEEEEQQQEEEEEYLFNDQYNNQQTELKEQYLHDQQYKTLMTNNSNSQDTIYWYSKTIQNTKENIDPLYLSLLNEHKIPKLIHRADYRCPNTQKVIRFLWSVKKHNSIFLDPVYTLERVQGMQFKNQTHQNIFQFELQRIRNLDVQQTIITWDDEIEMSEGEFNIIKKYVGKFKQFNFVYYSDIPPNKKYCVTEQFTLYKNKYIDEDDGKKLNDKSQQLMKKLIWDKNSQPELIKIKQQENNQLYDLNFIHI